MTSDVSAQGLYTDGHADIGVGYEGGELELHWHVEGGTVDGSTVPDQEFDPDQLIAVTSLMLTGGRPAGSPWDPIGNNAGDAVWYLPQSDIAGAPFLGLATEELDPGDWNGGMTWEIVGVTGPGEFSLWQNGAPNPNFFVSSVDGLPDSFTRGIGGHDHYNYGFTALGTYDVTFQVSATHVSDGFRSDTATFRFSAVPEPGSCAALASLSAVGLLVRRRKKL